MEPQPMVENLIYVVMGFVAIFLHWVKEVVDAKKAKNEAGLTFADLGAYIALNQLAVVTSAVTYLLLIGVWELNGFDFFGWVEGQLNGAVLGVGYMSDSVFKSFVDIAVKKTKEQP